MPVLLICLIIIGLFMPGQASAKTLILDGALESRIRTTQQIGFEVDREVKTLSFKFAVPMSFHNKATSQNVDDLKIVFVPEPASVVDETDKFGNRFRKVKWEHLNRNAGVTISFNVNIKAELMAMESTAPFPLTDLSKDESMFLKSTALVQSDDEEIISISKRLTESARTQSEAVSAILNWVADNVKYTYNPPQYDALYTVRTGKGNCQNFAHLSMALLRAAGIPARIVGGIGLKRQWKVPVESGYLVQDMGQGGHAWMEIFFKDLGWLSYDPQQTRQFTSTRHIKQSHGLDSRDINDAWSGSPYLPKYSESIEAIFNADDVNISFKKSVDEPKSYLMSNNLIAKLLVVSPEPVEPKPPKKPKPPVIGPEPVVKPKKGIFEFGNTDFPALVNIYQTVGNEGTRIFDKETAEFVTSKYVYAQAFTVDDNVALHGISLAMRKFGGDGSLYVDIVKDEDGKPGFSGERSLPLSLGGIKFRPGYYWIDFIFARGTEPLPVLSPGRYWIILRHSGEAIVNWFYIPGNSYGDGDDTRSTLKGYKWEDLLNYDFVFKVKAERR